MSASENRARNNVILSMLIYGTIGVVVRHISMPSAVISMFRGVIGAPFLLLVTALMKKRLDFAAIKANALFLLLSGAMLGINWMLLFASYNYTSVAAATLCYYLAPIILVAVSPFLFGEKMTVKKVLCILAALAGMFFVSGTAENGIPSLSELKGLMFAVAAAFLYAAIVSLNKKILNISPYDKTIVQLAISAAVMLPYNLLLGNFAGMQVGGTDVILMLLLGIVHTGIAYLLYFGSTADLPAQSLAILSYIDPVVAVLLSALVLREKLTVGTAIGAVLIIGAAIVSEFKGKVKENG